MRAAAPLALVLTAVLASTVVSAAPAPAAPEPPATPTTPEPSLDFDLLTPKSPTGGGLEFDLLAPSESAVPAAALDPKLEAEHARRRTMLTVHQGLGMSLVALMAGTMITGQLNYSDRFGAAASGRFEGSHKLFAYTTLGTFAATGLMAVLAPPPAERRDRGFDRVMLHRIGLFGAAAGMATQAVLGIATARSDGLLQQQQLGTAHLVCGYTTLAFMALGVGAIVF